MEFRYSKIIDPGEYETQGLCDGIDLRRHTDEVKEIEGALRAQHDWGKLVAPIADYKGGLGDKYSFIRITVPECLPERLEVISYANEFAFLYDDVMENIDTFAGSGDETEFLDVFCKGVLDQNITSKSSGEKQIQSQILSQMTAIDRERANITMNAWATFIQLAAARERSQPFATLEEYLPYRIIDAGEMIWFGTLTFAMALTIPLTELDLCKSLAKPAFAAISLTNDLFSWEKERDAARRDGLPHVVNAIWVIMREASVTEGEARAICRTKIKEYVSESIKVVEAAKINLDLSLDLRKYLEAVQYSLSGNLVWSIYCPRYHPSVPS